MTWTVSNYFVEENNTYYIIDSLEIPKANLLFSNAFLTRVEDNLSSKHCLAKNGYCNAPLSSALIPYYNLSHAVEVYSKCLLHYLIYFYMHSCHVLVEKT